MSGLISGNGRSYDNFKKQLTPKIQSDFDSVRKFCFSLGKNVIEDVRMHRIVFGKSMIFRWFVDMEPQQNSIILKIQSERKQPPLILEVKPGEDLYKIKSSIKNAYNTIR